MLSATTTIETGFGSRVTTGGFLLNNELTDFAFEPEEDGKPVANRVEGGKRPRSSMAPTIVFRDDAPVLLIGSPGGANIIAYVAGALIGMLDFGLDPQAAIDRPHAADRNAGAQVEAGPEAEAAIAALAELGHQAEATDLNSGLHAIRSAPTAPSPAPPTSAARGWRWASDRRPAGALAPSTHLLGANTPAGGPAPPLGRRNQNRGAERASA